MRALLFGLRDGEGRTFDGGLVQSIFTAAVFVLVFPILLLGLVVAPPAKRWGDPRYRW